jgi:hypothetical protein
MRWRLLKLLVVMLCWDDSSLATPSTKFNENLTPTKCNRRLYFLSVGPDADQLGVRGRGGGWEGVCSVVLGIYSTSCGCDYCS